MFNQIYQAWSNTIIYHTFLLISIGWMAFEMSFEFYSLFVYVQSFLFSNFLPSLSMAFQYKYDNHNNLNAVCLLYMFGCDVLYFVVLLMWVSAITLMISSLLLV